MTNAALYSFFKPDSKNWLIRKYPDAGKDGRQEEKETKEDEMVGWHDIVGKNLPFKQENNVFLLKPKQSIKSLPIKS